MMTTTFLTPRTIARETAYELLVADLLIELLSQKERGEIISFSIHADDNYYEVTDDEEGTLVFPIDGAGYADTIDEGDDPRLGF